VLSRRKRIRRKRRRRKRRKVVSIGNSCAVVK